MNEFISYSPKEDLGEEGVGKTPLKNQTVTPDTKYTIKLDYLNLIIQSQSIAIVNQVIEDLAELFTDRFEFLDRPLFKGRTYDGGFAKSIYGIQVAWDDFSNHAKPTARISIPGKPFSRIDLAALAAFLIGLKDSPEYGEVRCTRIDAAFDDYSKQLFDSDLLQRVIDERLYFKLRKPFVNTSGHDSDPWGKGWTYRFGSGRKSLYFYNKAAESKGHYDCHRAEVRYKEKDAQEAFQYLMSIPDHRLIDEIPTFLSGLVSGVADFVEAWHDRNHALRDGTRMPWWSTMREILSNFLRFTAKPEKTCLSRKIAWFDHSVLPTLSVIVDTLGSDWVHHRVEQIRKHRRSYLDNLVEISKLELSEGLS